jgi:glutamine cyclotransferase
VKVIKTLYFVSVASLIAIAICGCSKEKNTQTPANYTYQVVKTYPHDENAFTQGLVFEDGFLYEGTGLEGRSSLRKVELDTGKVLQIYRLPNEFFGEGITIFGNNIIQLTYRTNVGFVFDKGTFKQLRQFNYPTEGWGLTHNNKQLIMSDGSATLYFLDPETFKQTSSIIVRDNGVALQRLNELEYIDGKIYANIWQTNRIAIIDPDTGRVTGWLDLTGLLPQRDINAVLNGIAYDRINRRLFVTGKFWPKLFEIKLIPK